MRNLYIPWILFNIKFLDGSCFLLRVVNGYAIVNIVEPVGQALEVFFAWLGDILLLHGDSFVLIPVRGNKRESQNLIGRLNRHKIFSPLQSWYLSLLDSVPRGLDTVAQMVLYPCLRDTPFYPK